MIARARRLVFGWRLRADERRWRRAVKPTPSRAEVLARIRVHLIALGVPSIGLTDEELVSRIYRTGEALRASGITMAEATRQMQAAFDAARPSWVTFEEYQRQLRGREDT